MSEFLKKRLADAERKLAGITVGEMTEVRLITGVTASGKLRFVSKTASQTTRTYRLEIELPNADGAIPDGISADVSIPLAPIPPERNGAPDRGPISTRQTRRRGSRRYPAP